MKKLFTLMALALICTAATAQDNPAKTDTIPSPQEKKDTIRIGNIIIVKKSDRHTEPENNNHDWNNNNNLNINITRRHRELSNLSTNWFIIDLGFANYTDKTNYAGATANQTLVNQPGTGFPLGASDFKLKTEKSVDVNLWLFMQRLNLVKHHINLKYGLGLELNNYRYRSNISFKEPGYSPYNSTTAVPHAYIIRDSINFTKNKLSAEYITIPVMINFSSKPGDFNRGISFSAGISAGYLYGERNKQKSQQRGKLKNKGDYDMEQFKLSYIAELGLGPVRLYGSYSPKSMFNNGLDLRPYTLGIRLSNW